MNKAFENKKERKKERKKEIINLKIIMTVKTEEEQQQL